MSERPLLAGRRAVVFDAYGTLFDVHSAVQRHADAVGPAAARLSELWRVKQLEYSWTLSLIGRTAPFWQLTERALDFALASHPDVDAGLRDRLLDAYRDLDAYGEVPGVLERLRARGLSTAILSNGDDAMLGRSVASAGLASGLDAVLSADAAGVFKTHPRAYAVALDALGVPAEAVLFCSSNRWDIAGATAFGFACAWINRTGKPDEYADLAPVAVLSDLAGLF
ncbi:haloacid dehalogenase type II [Methylobacterium sp. E-041]|uniref:haloacid dehalogenase type II n=1 Tax=Methylobacterium sp. E-041 TaxID=2836573 RepID=UPI001FB9C5B6|nr:haloacid dehalogenase type II [Methylobacterium sp. E-041]MCJ2104938.1 haloacid dehalogenase type II [Methylobacterium sp. E-041]